MNELTCTALVRTRACLHDPALDRFMDWLPCEYCGASTNTPERHHRRFRSRGGLWAPSNVILLCAGCHGRTTREEMPGSGLNVPSTVEPWTVPVSVWYEESLVFFDDAGGYLPA